MLTLKRIRKSFTGYLPLTAVPVRRKPVVPATPRYLEISFMRYPKEIRK